MLSLLQGVLAHVINPVRQLYEHTPAQQLLLMPDTACDHTTVRIPNIALVILSKSGTHEDEH